MRDINIEDNHPFIEIDLTLDNVPLITEWSLLSTPIVESMVSENPDSIFLVCVDGSVQIRKKNTPYNRAG